METKQTTKPVTGGQCPVVSGQKLSLPPRAVCMLSLKKAAKAPALRVPRGVDVSPLVVVAPPSRRNEETQMTKDEGLSQKVAKLEAEIAELRAERGRNAPTTGVAAVIEQLACERVARELAAMVTAETPKPQVKRRWWQWW